MSTRCQVSVKGGLFPEQFTLYHHTDGYPEVMIPLIQRAWEMQAHNVFVDPYVSEKDWRKGRTGKVASFLCAADPGVMEPENSHELHQDTEYYYEIFVNQTNDGFGWDIRISDGNLNIIDDWAPLERVFRKYEQK